MRKTGFAVLMMVVLASLGCSNPFTPAGHEGYVYESPRVFGKGGFKGVIKGPGNFGASLWRNRAINIDIRPTTYIEQFKILAKDDLNVTFKFEAVVKITPGQVTKVVLDYAGLQWYIRFVKEPFRSFVRNSTPKIYFPRPQSAEGDHCGGGENQAGGVFGGLAF